MHPRHAAAFTLFEVMISLLVLTVAILTTIALLPIGLQAQQLARSQMYAASTAVSLMYEFHNPVSSFEGISRLAPAYNGVPGTDTTSTSQPPYSGWAENMRWQSVYSSPYQPNAEQALCGWFTGVLPVPLEIAHRLDSDNDEIQTLLDQGGMLFYSDPNLLQGLNQGAETGKTIQVLPSPEMQKLVFAFMGYPQQNALSSFPVDSYPYYEVYPFPPAWLSLQASGRDLRLLQYIEYGNVGNSRGGNGYGSRTGISWAGRTTSDWSWEGGLLCLDDAGHAEYQPVTWGTPMRLGQDVPQWSPNKALDDPDSSDEYTSFDASTAFYEGNGHPIGRDWRYFATDNGVPAASNQWMLGNGQAPIADPYYTNPLFMDPATSTAWNKEWAWFCFQRLSGVDAAWVGYPANAYANASQLNNTTVAATTISTVTSDTNPPTAVYWPPATTVTVPSKSFAAHPPALFYRAGWLPIRGLLCNPEAPSYMGIQDFMDPDEWNQSSSPAKPVTPNSNKQWAPTGWQDNDTHVWGDQVSAGANDGQRFWNVAQAAGIPKTSQPMATYEMRANYRDRALDLWQAVMPTHSNLAQLEKNPDTTQYANPFSAGIPGESNSTQNSQYYASLVEESMGGTMVDCCKYEYPPMELDRFQFITPSQLSAADWPIHPAQIEALSFLAHAAMMVTGYGPPFDQQMPQLGSTQQDLMKLSWEALNWTYMITPEEEYANEHAGGSNPPFPQLPLMNGNINTNVLATQDGYLPAAVPGFIPAGTGGQGIVKDALVCAADVLNPYSGSAVTGNQIKQTLGSSATWYIDVCNPTAYDFVVFPGDEIVLEPSYYQYYYRHDIPTRPGGPSWWGNADPHDVMPFADMSWSPWNYYESYDTDTNNSFPNMNYKLQTFRVVAVEQLTLNPMSSGLPNTYPAGAVQCTYNAGPGQTAPNSPPSSPTPSADIPPAVHPGGAPQWVGGYMGYPQPQPGSVYGEEISWGSGHPPQPARTTLSFPNGLQGMRLWLNAPIPTYPEFPGDAHVRPGYVSGAVAPDKNGVAGAFNGSPAPGTISGAAEGTGISSPFPNPTSQSAYMDPISLHAGVLIRRICNPSDRAFARKVYEMCMQWAAAYAAENPNDFGAPRMANHQSFMDEPLAMFDLFYDAANGGAAGNAIRASPLAHQTSDGSTAGEQARRSESYYRWMVPTNNAPTTWFFNDAVPDATPHANSHLAPGPARYDYYNQMVHNNQLNEPASNYDDAHFWLTKPFSPFVRTRTLKFWSVDWKSYQDAEMVPSAPIDFAKHNRSGHYDPTVSTYSSISPNGAYGYATGELGDGHNPLCGLPESLYVWTSASRDTRYGDVVGGELAGYLYQNWNGAFNMPLYANTEPTLPSGSHVTADIHLGHWGADRNGNGKLDIGPIPPSTRMRAITVGEYLYYDPVLRLNISN